jgi:transposase
MRPKGSAEQLEARRRLAVRLLDEGRSITEVAELVEASVSSVKRWRSTAINGGIHALQARPHHGPGFRLTKEQEEELTEILKKGDPETGLQPRDWTCPRIAELIEARFGVVYHADHIWRLLRRLGWRHDEERGWVHEPDRKNV